jgi:transcription elongation factor GreA
MSPDGEPVMKVPMTRRGYDRMQEEVVRLKKVERPQIIVAIAEARAHGDLKENAEYAAAREKQGFIEGRIIDLESKLAQAEIIETDGLATDKVVFGATVHLMNLDINEEKRYTIVGQDEADLQNGMISIHSPVARSLIGRRVGEFVTITAPARTIEYEVLKISFE